MNLFDNRDYVTIKATGKQGEIVHYLGSNIYKVRYRDGNITKVFSFRESELDWTGVDKEAIQRRYM